MNIEQTIIENNKRIAKFNRHYDPLLGIGSLIDREKLVLDDLGEFYLPKAFFNTVIGHEITNSGSLRKLVERNTTVKNTDQAFKFFVNERIRHDFEFHAAYSVKIKPKAGGDFIPFILNDPQQKLNKAIYDKIIEEKPIRLIVCKSRQWGGSTEIQNEMLWIQLIHKTNWNSLIAAHLNQAATNIRKMVSTVQKEYPKTLEHFSLIGFEGQTNVKFIPERNNKITIGSVQAPDSIRSDDVAMAHLSEVGLWRKTEGRSPEDLCQSILGTIPRLPWTFYALESTAKGVGNFFHKEWQKAVDGEKNNMTPIFVSWIEDKNNQEQFRSENQMIQFIKSWSAYELFLWNSGATVEGINFYRNKLAEMGGDEWRMKSEFPTTADEAFQSSGQRVFHPDYVLRIRKTCRKPEAIGGLFSDSRTGESALKNIVFNAFNKGNLSVWNFPQSSVTIKGREYRVVNRYCGFADIGGRTKGADFSELTIIDRYWMIEGGLPEVAAQWHGHLDQDLFAWQCAMIGWWYNKMLLAVETNSLKTKETEGNHFHTILDEISSYYPNLFIRNNQESINTDFEPKYGFHTNAQSKGMIMDNLNALLREEGYIERDSSGCDQLDYYEVKPNGSLGAVDGEKDDKVITKAGALWLACKYMDPPKLVEIKTKEHKYNKNGRNRIITEASI